MAKHLASFALIGATGKRVGTRFIFEESGIAQAIQKPHFRFRNNDCRAAWLAWRRSDAVSNAKEG